MGSLLMPLAASGGPAAVTLVEIKAARAASAPIAPPLPDPFPVPSGHFRVWALPTVVDTVYTGGGSAAGTVATSLVAAHGTMTMTSSRPLGGWFNAVRWSNFSLMPALLPSGAVITGIYPVIIAAQVHDQAFHYLGYGTGLDLGFSTGASFPSFTSTASFPATEFYGASIGTTMAALTGMDIQAELNASLSIDGALDSITVTGVGFAIDYTFPTPPTSSQIGDAALQRMNGTYFWSEHKALWPSLLEGGAIAQYLDWLVGAQEFHLFGSTQTDTAVITVQNVSGNTIERDATMAFTKTELIGALVAARIWRGDAEAAMFTFIGNVVTVDVDIEGNMQLNCEGLGNWSAISAPSYNIDTSCPLTFGSRACGSTSPTPCDQTYGTCSQINRFAGVLAQWLIETPDIQIAQPAPAAFFNPARPF